MNPLLHIRKNVFGITQAEMAAIASVAQGTVSKWENGISAPDRNNLSRIRHTAALRGLAWNDSWLFETP
jgi:transcriptional regulator with XRE-family HTH domain